MPDFRKYLEQLRGLSDQQKKAIIIVIVVVLGIILGFFWLKASGNRLNKLGETTGDINLPEIEMPKIELPLQIQNK